MKRLVGVVADVVLFGLSQVCPRNQWPTRTDVNGGIDRRVVRRTVGRRMSSSGWSKGVNKHNLASVVG